MPVKTFTFKNEVFVTSRTSCADCGHKFKYSLPFALLLVWDRRCVLCSRTIMELPDKGKWVMEPIDIMEWT